MRWLTRSAILLDFKCLGLLVALVLFLFVISKTVGRMLIVA